MAEWQPGPESSPYDAIGGSEAVRALAEAFYEEMFQSEPELTRLHTCGPDGRVAKERRDRFALFLVGWLGGPQDYMAQHGHPRLRMRHATVPIDSSMRDAWVRCMAAAMEKKSIPPAVQAYLRPQFAQVADFLRNVLDSEDESSRPP
jgi:hemoglobin